jgi:hypothetical protein
MHLWLKVNLHGYLLLRRSAHFLRGKGCIASGTFYFPETAKHDTCSLHAFSVFWRCLFLVRFLLFLSFFLRGSLSGACCTEGVGHRMHHHQIGVSGATQDSCVPAAESPDCLSPQQCHHWREWCHHSHRLLRLLRSSHLHLPLLLLRWRRWPRPSPGWPPPGSAASPSACVHKHAQREEVTSLLMHFCGKQRVYRQC